MGAFSSLFLGCGPSMAMAWLTSIAVSFVFGMCCCCFMQ
jgi:hypothetical protein